VIAGVHARGGNGMDRTRRGQLAGAAGAFAEHGVRGTSMQAIAAAAGVAKGTLYNHFRTKDDVLRVLLRTELDRLADLATALPRDQALAALADELGAHPVLRRVADDEPGVLAALTGVGGERWSQLTGRLAAALRIRPDAAELAARWLLGVVLQPGHPLDRHRQAARLAAALVDETGDGSVERERATEHEPIGARSGVGR
jgi:AcrR family transcriptional regulator